MGNKVEFKELKDLFKTNSRALEVLFLLVGAKPCVRLLCYQQELLLLETFCAKHELWMDNSDFKIHLLKDDDKGGYSNKGLIVNAKSPVDGQVAVYISKDDMLVRHAKEHERLRDDYKLGLDLGYPECCCEFFIENRKEQAKKQNDFVMPCMKNSTMDVFPFHLNNTLRYFDKVVVPHFPCSYDCEKSKMQAKHFMQIIDAYTDFGDHYMSLLKSPVVYSETNGVFRLKNANVKDLEITYSGVEGTVENTELFELLDHADKIEIKGRDYIKLYKGDVLLHDIHDPSFCVLLFE